MRDHDNLAALIDDAGALADQFCSSLPGAGGAADLDVRSPIADKAAAYREMLYCRFADQVFSAARSAHEPVTACVPCWPALSPMIQTLSAGRPAPRYAKMSVVALP